jgi:hypothetical protein
MNAKLKPLCGGKFVIHRRDTQSVGILAYSSSVMWPCLYRESETILCWKIHGLAGHLCVFFNQKFVFCRLCIGRNDDKNPPTPISHWLMGFCLCFYWKAQLVCIHMIFSKFFFFLGGGGCWQWFGSLYNQKFVSVCVSIQTSPRVHPASYTMNTDISTWELQQPESEADHSSLSGAWVVNS